MAPASSLLHKSSMTKKRFKFGLAVLGGITAFLLALLALLFVPTLASADKSSGMAYEDEGKSGNPNPAYFEHVEGAENGQGGSDSASYEVAPCGEIANPCAPEDHDAPGGDGSWNYSDGQGGQGDGHGPNNDSGNNGHGGQGNPPGPFTGGYFGPPGGGSSGGGGGGTPQDESKSCSSQDSGNAGPGNDADDKTCDKGNDDSQHQNVVDNQPGDSSNDPSGDPTGDPSTNLVNNDPPGGDLPPGDPNCFPFADRCGPQDGNPPNTDLTDPPSEVPEPITLSLFAAGLAGAAALRRRAGKK